MVAFAVLAAVARGEVRARRQAARGRRHLDGHVKEVGVGARPARAARRVVVSAAGRVSLRACGETSVWVIRRAHIWEIDLSDGSYGTFAMRECLPVKKAS